MIYMETVKIYLSGGMSSLSLEEQTKWRKQIINSIKFGDYDCKKKAYFFNPVDYYDLEEKLHRSSHEIVEFDLNALRNSDLVIVNFNDPKSVGTISELAIAHELKIPIVGINKNEYELHPWLVEFVCRMCKDVRETVEYVVDFYLN